MNLKYFAKIVIGIGFVIWITGCATTPWDQEQADLHLKIGIAHVHADNYTSALKELLQAEKLGKPNAQVHYLLGVSYYYGKGLNELAISEVKKAVSIDPNYSEAYNFLGVIYSGMGKWDQAIEAFEKALSNILYDTPAFAHYNMGWAYYRKGDYASAQQQYQLAVANKVDPILLPILEKNWGIVLYSQGQTVEALKHLQKSVGLVPSMAESYYWIGQCFMEQKNKEKAKAAFQEVVKLAPDTEWSAKSKKRIDELSSSR
jgi:tetratricopeptide (TPR) repeat protein